MTGWRNASTMLLGRRLWASSQGQIVDRRLAFSRDPNDTRSAEGQAWIPVPADLASVERMTSLGNNDCDQLEHSSGHFNVCRNAIRSRSCSNESWRSSPSGMTETGVGVISSISVRKTRLSLPSVATRYTASAVSR